MTDPAPRIAGPARPSFFARLGKSYFGVIGLSLCALIVLAMAAASLPGLPDPVQLDLRARMTAPTLGWQGSGAHPFGTDQLGRDMLSRILHGTRTTLAVSLSAVLCAGLIGTTVGLIAAYFGGLADRILMRFGDMQLAVPMTLLAITVLVTLGSTLVNLVVVLTMASWAVFARMVRGQVMAVMQQDFILGAIAVGAPTLRIMLRHILPNILGVVLVVMSLELSKLILLEASLSFLGLGIQPPHPSLGRMLAEGRTYMATAWWITLFPGLVIMACVLVVNFLGDWLRDAFDPRLMKGN